MGSEKAVDTAALQELLLSLHREPESVARETFKRLVQDAAQPRHISGNACIKLAYFLEQCRKSGSPTLNSLAYSRETCQDLFDFYVEWNEKNQHRSMRQILEILAVLISKNPSPEVGNAFKADALARLVAIVRHQTAQPLVKPAFKVLDYFLTKGTITVFELFMAYGQSFGPDIASFYRPEAALVGKNWGPFVADVFEWMSLPDTASSAGKLLVSLFAALKTASAQNGATDESHSAHWSQLIQEGLAKYPESLDNIKNYLFLDLFKVDKSGSLEFLKSLSKGNPFAPRHQTNGDSDSHASLFLSAMEMGKKLGLVDDPDIIPPKAKSKKRDFVALPSTMVGEHLIHPASTVRSSAFSVLVLSLSSTRPYPTESLDAIKQNLAILHADTDAKFRNELFANTKYMLERVKGASSLLDREIAFIDSQRTAEGTEAAEVEFKEAIKASLKNHLREHRNFLQWYLSFLAKELVPTASYQRHTTALKTIEIALKTGLQGCPTASTTPTGGLDNTWTKQVVFTQTMVRLLLDLLLDPFEEVRNCSLAVLKYAPKEAFGPLVKLDSPEQQPATVPKLLAELAGKAADASAKTGRADFADGLAFTYVLHFKFSEGFEQRYRLFQTMLDSLDADISIASSNLEQAAQLHPVHGQFATIGQLWDLMDAPTQETWESLQSLEKRLVNSCLASWSTVKDVLCNDSPEGHIPFGSTATGDIDIKGILSYCFRACHESSLLVQALVRKLPITREGQPFLPFSHFTALGNLAFKQLSTLRHRGAFSTVTLTFNQVCRATQTPTIVGKTGSEELNGSQLLRTWYQGALTCIGEQNSTTRRSAGIPALITGILSASSKELTFDSIMRKLMVLARAPVIDIGKDEVRLPQVHAMNSLTDVFKSATLGKKADSYITECFQVAADSMKSNIWAISNCGLLMVKALIDCMLGTSESKASAEAGWDGRSIRISYERYPTLPDLLLRLLGTDINVKVVAKEVFPALEFLRRVGPPEEKTMLREQFFACVVIHLDSETWDVRDLAARTACTFLLNDDWKTVIDDLLDFFRTSTNGLHGVVLLVKYVLRRRRDLSVPTETAQLDALYRDMFKACRLNSTKPTDAIVHAAYQEALAAIASLDPESTIDAGQLVPGSLLTKAPPQVLADIVALPLDVQRRKPELTARVSDAKARVTNVVASMTADNATAYIKLVNSTEFSLDSDEDVVVAMLEMLHGDSALQALLEHDVVQNVICMKQFLVNPWPARVQTAATRTMANLLHRLDVDTLTEKQIKTLATAIQTPDLLDFCTTHKERRNGKSVDIVNGPELTNALLHVKGGALRLAVKDLFAGQHVNDAAAQMLQQQARMFGTEISWALNNDDVDFHYREAALLAADAFYAQNKYFAAAPPGEDKNIDEVCLSHMLPLNLAILSALSDDDDEIRDLAAKVVGRLCQKVGVPEAALPIWKDWLVRYYTTEGQHAEDFAKEVVLRVIQPRTRFAPPQGWENMSVKDELDHALVEDNALFVQESQNLYIDEVVQSQIWIDFFSKLTVNTRIATARQIGPWAREGLEVLSEMSKQRYDGPFGWTAKPEVFAIVSKVIMAARATFQVLKETMEVWGDNDDEGVLVEMMDELEFQSEMLNINGGKNGLHPLLIDQLEWMVVEFDPEGNDDEESDDEEVEEGVEDEDEDEEMDFDGQNFDFGR